ncbi:hypothetical protein BY996DRAFT_6418267 [Phakopsora pachyrhizi]|nr:hypothetical protein BY996DRAFT_6418267 [Phakopsora pachyrhizi]
MKVTLWFFCLLGSSITLLAVSQNVTSTTPIRVGDVHSGVERTFDKALHDPTVALQTSGSKLDVTCPAADNWNQKALNSSRTAISDDDREELWIISYLDEHPDQTLWDLFSKTLSDDISKWIHGPNPLEKALDVSVEFVADVLQQFVLMIWAAFKWVVKFPFQAKKEWKELKLPSKLGGKLAGALFLKSPIDGIKTIVGGLFLHYLLHPAEFTAETILLVGAGFQVIHAFMHGVEIVAGTLPEVVRNSLLSVLMFIHMLDDPLLILTPVLTKTAQSMSAVQQSASISENVCEQDGGFTSNDGSKSISLPPEITLNAAPNCPLRPPEVGAPPLTYSDLCLNSDPSRIRMIVFGTSKPSEEMKPEERLKAYNHVRKFWCCYGQGLDMRLPSSVLKDLPGNEKWEGSSYWKETLDCEDLKEINEVPQSGRLKIS